MLSPALVRTISRRLAPLYVAAFFQSFVLWYTIEKLFMRTIGFNNITISVMVAVYSFVMLATETPSGILADRWSRKGVLIIASISISLSSLIGGLSHGFHAYIVCAVLWGIFFACYSGLYESIVYDVLAEISPKHSLFDRFYGRIQLLDSISLVVSSLAGSLIASQLNLRAAYFWSIPFAIIPIIALLRFKEPTLHRQHAVIPLPQQISDTFRAVTRSREILPVVIVLILRATVVYCIFESSQLWLLALHTPTQYYGIANAALLSSIGIGGIAVSRLKLSRFFPMMLLLVILIIGNVGLIVFRNTAGIVMSGFLLASTLISIYVIFSRILHDNLPASIRAGAASASSTLARFAIIPTALLIGYVSQRYTIYKAAIILLVLSLTMSWFVYVVARRNQHTGLVAPVEP